MQGDTSKIWTPAEIRTSLDKILVESLGVDESLITDDAALIRDLGAESIDFLDISFKCQQTFAVDLPARLVQDRLLEWRDLSILSRLLADRYGVTIGADELRTIAPSTPDNVLAHLQAKHGLRRSAGDVEGLVHALASRLLDEFQGSGLDLDGLDADGLSRHLVENLHSPAAAEELLNRFTVAALADYVARRLDAGSRLASA